MDPADFYWGIVVDASARLTASRFDPQPCAQFLAEHGQPAVEWDRGLVDAEVRLSEGWCPAQAQPRLTLLEGAGTCPASACRST